jgi:hypothetical protein
MTHNIVSVSEIGNNGTKMTAEKTQSVICPPLGNAGNFSPAERIGSRHKEGR